MGLLKDIKTLLTSESNIYIGDMPDTPNNLCCLYNTGGFDSRHSLGSSTATYDEPTFQIRIRDSSYSSGVTRCEAIMKALDGKTNQTINSKKYITIFKMGDINGLGKDSKNRSEFTLNFRARVKRI